MLRNNADARRCPYFELGLTCDPGREVVQMFFFFLLFLFFVLYHFMLGNI